MHECRKAALTVVLGSILSLTILSEYGMIIGMQSTYRHIKWHCNADSDHQQTSPTFQLYLISFSSFVITGRPSIPQLSIPQSCHNTVLTCHNTVLTCHNAVLTCHNTVLTCSIVTQGHGLGGSGILL